MCGRYVSTSSLADLAEAYGVDEVVAEDLGPRWNVAPTQSVYAVAVSRQNPRRLLGTYRWGLIPSWAPDEKIGSKLINARAESVAEKPAYRKALARRRCVIPADAFYEWQAQPEGPDGKRGRLPYAIRRRDEKPLSFAGLYEIWSDPEVEDAERIRSAVIVTTRANRALSAIHDRMPVVLPDEVIADWLDPTVEDVARVQRLLVPAPDEWWEAWAIGTRVNSVTNEGAELLEPLASGG